MNELASRLGKSGPVKVNEFMIRAQIKDHDEIYELTVFRDGRAIVKGTHDASVARGVYAKYVGV